MLLVCIYEFCLEKIFYFDLTRKPSLFVNDLHFVQKFLVYSKYYCVYGHLKQYLFYVDFQLNSVEFAN